MFTVLVHAIVLARVSVNALVPALVRVLALVTGALVGENKSWFNILFGEGGEICEFCND